MKAIKSIFIVALLFIALPSQAKDGKRGDRKVKQKVAAVISSNNSEMEGAVNAKFKVESDGSIQILSIESTKHGLKELVVEKLKNIKIKGEIIDVNKLFNMNFIFHREKG